MLGDKECHLKGLECRLWGKKTVSRNEDVLHMMSGFWKLLHSLVFALLIADYALIVIHKVRC